MARITTSEIQKESYRLASALTDCVAAMSGEFPPALRDRMNQLVLSKAKEALARHKKFQKSLTVEIRNGK